MSACERHGFSDRDDAPVEPCVMCGRPRDEHPEGECRGCLGNGWKPGGDLNLPAAARTREPCSTCGGYLLDLPSLDRPHVVVGTGLAKPGDEGW